MSSFQVIETANRRKELLMDFVSRMVKGIHNEDLGKEQTISDVVECTALH